MKVGIQHFILKIKKLSYPFLKYNQLINENEFIYLKKNVFLFKGIDFFFLIRIIYTILNM